MENATVNIEQEVLTKALGIYFKPYLKPHEAEVFCSLGNKQLTERLREFGVIKTSTGYYKREDLIRMMEGKQLPQTEMTLSRFTQPRANKRRTVIYQPS